MSTCEPFRSQLRLLTLTTQIENSLDMEQVMSDALKLSRFSIGVGDRFAHQAKAQLAACVLAAEAGVDVVPVWNKSNREHTIIGSEPSQTRVAADAAVKALGWTKPYFLDADHIGLKTVRRFLTPCDFFTLDVAEGIGRPAKSEDIDAFVERLRGEYDTSVVPGRFFGMAKHFRVGMGVNHAMFVEGLANIERLCLSMPAESQKC